MAKFKQTFTGNANKLLGEYQKLEQQNAKLLTQQQKLTEQSRRAEGAARKFGDTSGSAATRAVSGMQNVALQAVSAQGAVKLVTGAYKEWIREIKKLGDEHTRTSKSVVRDLAETGDLLRGEEVTQALRATPFATFEQGRAAFAGVSGGAPAESLERRLKLARAVSTQAATEVDLSKLGELVGELSQIFPKKSAGDVVDIGVNLRSQAGREIEKVGGPSLIRAVKALAASGAATPTEALGLGLTALKDANLRPDVLVTAASQIAAQRDLIAPRSGRELTDAELAKNRFTLASPRERLGLLQDDAVVRQSVLGVDQGSRFALIDPEAARRRSRELRDAQVNDAALRQVEALGGFGEGAASLRRQFIDVSKEKETQAIAAREAQGQAAFDFVLSRNLDEGFLEQAKVRNVNRIRQRFPREGRTGAEEVITSAARVGEISQAEAEAFRRADAASERQIRLLEEQVQNMTQQTDMLGAIRDSLQAQNSSAAASVGVQDQDK